MEESEPPAAEPGSAPAPEEPEAPVAPEHGVLSVKVKIHRLNIPSHPCMVYFPTFVIKIN